MAFIKKRELQKMSKKDRTEKLKELKMELVKAGVTAHKANAKTKELKRTIAKLLTMEQHEKLELAKRGKELEK